MKKIHLMKLKMGSKLDLFQKEMNFLHAVMQIKKNIINVEQQYHMI